GFRYGAEVQLNWEERAGRMFTFGVTGDALATRSSFFTTDNDDEFGSQPEIAFFTQWEENVSDKLQLVAGFRFDRYQIDGAQSVSKLSPKISAAYLLSDIITLRAAFGDGFRVPSFAERFTDNRDFFPIVRNLGLKPERSRSYEIGIKSRMPHPRAGLFRSDIAIFWNEYWNLIEPKLVPALQAFQFVNLTRARIRGGEAALEWELPRRELKFRAGYTFLDADDLDENVALAFRSKHLVVLSLDGHVYGPLSLGVDFRFVSKPERLDTDFSRFIADADVLVDTQVIDARASIRVGNLSAALLVNNLGQYYYLERPALLGPPRRATLQLQYDF
ncbi:MAG: TonB-dependent receptor, partial [Bacteroidetes bacterium]